MTKLTIFDISYIVTRNSLVNGKVINCDVNKLRMLLKVARHTVGEKDCEKGEMFNHLGHLYTRAPIEA